MIKKIAWNTFKNTGNINTMMELIKTDEVLENSNLEIANENDLKTANLAAEEKKPNGSSKNQWNSTSHT